MGNKSGMHMLALWLLIIGGLNWLVLALFNWDLSALVGGMDSVVAKIIYVLVGLAALYEIFMGKGGKTDGQPGV